VRFRAPLQRSVAIAHTIKVDILLMRNYRGYRKLDFDTTEDSFNYGGNIYKDYDLKRPFDGGVKWVRNKTSLLLQIFKEDI
jgi:hypothetical protein